MDGADKIFDCLSIQDHLSDFNKSEFWKVEKTTLVYSIAKTIGLLSTLLRIQSYNVSNNKYKYNVSLNLGEKVKMNFFSMLYN